MQVLRQAWWRTGAPWLFAGSVYCL